MDRIGLLVCLLLLGCDVLWVPTLCLDNPQAAGCQLDYRVVPDYSLLYASQTWLLNPPPPGVPANLDLLSYDQAVTTNLENNHENSPENLPIDARKIHSDGRIEIFHQGRQGGPDKITGINLELGADPGKRIPLRRISIECNADMSKVVLGVSPDGLIVKWGGLRQRFPKSNFLISKRETIKPLGEATEFSSDRSPWSISTPQGTIQGGCELAVTKNFTLQYCPTGKGQLATILDAQQSVIKAGCESDAIDRVVYCSPSIGKLLGASSIDDVVAILSGPTVYLISITGDRLIRASAIAELPGSDLKTFTLSDIDHDGRADVIMSKVNGEIVVNLQQIAGLFAYSYDYSSLLQSALDRLQSIHPGAISALTVGRVFSGDLDLFVATEGAPGTPNLWLLSLEPSLSTFRPLDSPVLPPGTAGLNPFTESAQRLELGDLNGDDHLDLAYISQSAVHFCVTSVDP